AFLTALVIFFLITPPPPTPTLFPYTTLFRSRAGHRRRRRPNPAGREPLALHPRPGRRRRHLLWRQRSARPAANRARPRQEIHHRSEEHTSELQSRGHLVCRLLLEKKKKDNTK